MSKADDELLKVARERFAYVADVEARQRRREHDDLEFQVPELQWPDEARRQRESTTISGSKGGVGIPARPILSIPKLDQPVNLVLNQARNAHLGINIHPLSPEADDDKAEVIQGIYRQIERDSRANIARGWALDRAVKCGRGAYRVNTRYADEVSGGSPFDQVITIERILYQDTVYFDPASEQPDRSDAQWAFVTSWVPYKVFKKLYPKAQTLGGDSNEFNTDVREDPEWVQGEGDKGAVQIAEYFYKEQEKEVVYLFSDGEWGAEVPEGVEVIDQRERMVTRVYWSKLSGKDVLEGPVQWNGKYIPLIPVVGIEYQPFDEQRRFTGIIGPAKDAQRMYNYAASAAVEMAALEPKAPWIGVAGQFEGRESMWQQSNTRNFPYLEYEPVTTGDKPAPPPTRVPVDVSRLGPSMQLLQQGEQFIHSTTQTFNPSLGNVEQRDRSGKAIQALQEQGDLGNSHYMHGLVNISMTYEAKVVLDLMPAIYDRAGRVVRTLDDEDETETVMLNQPYVVHPKTKQPVPMQPGQPPPPKSAQSQEPAEVKHFDMQKGVYGVSVTIGRAYQTRLQQGAEEIGQILQARPELMPLIGPIYFKYRDFPGADAIAKLLKKAREKQYPGLDESDDDQPSPEQAAAQLQAAQQQIQQMQQALQEAKQEIDTQQAKQQATLQKAQMDNETKQAIAQMETQTKLLLAKMEERFEALQNQLDRVQETKESRFEAAHETGMAAAQAQSQPSQGEHVKEEAQK